MKKIIRYIKNNFKLIVPVLLIIVAILIIVILNFMKQNINEYKIEKAKTYIYFGQEKFEFDTELTLNAESGITKIKLNDQDVDLNSQPIYYTGLDKIILPQQMSVVYPSTGQSYKIPRFTNIEIKNNTNYTDASDKPLDNAFIYDGNDLYLFLDDCKLILGDTQVDLSPLSYVSYNYNGELYIYNHRDDQMHYLQNVTDDVFVETNKYKINLSIDSITANNKEKLLIKNFSYLDKLK